MFVLEKLWRGRISPSERKVHENSEYRRLLHELGEMDKCISAELSEEGKQRFKEYEEIQLELIKISEQDIFISAFRMGAGLLLDVIGKYDSQFYPAQDPDYA